MKFLNILTFAVLLGTIHLFSVGSYAQETVDPNPSLEQALREIGDKYDYYFTIESAVFLGDRIHSMESTLVCPRTELTNLKQELNRLRKSVPTLSYRFDNNNPKVIHIVEEYLDSQKDYSMEKMVDSLTFYGEAPDLIAAINRKGIAVSETGPVMAAPGVAAYYLPTKLRVEAKNRKVRDILTDCVPLKDRGRILWIAQTELAKEPTTIVHYLR